MELWILRVLHISCAILWAGAGITVGLFLMPAISAAGPGGGAVMRGLLARKFPLVMNLLAIVVALTGVRLYTIYYSTEWLGTATGILLTIGGVFGLAAAIVGALVQRPLAMKLGALGAAIAAGGGPPSAEQAAAQAELGRRLGNAARHNAFAMIVSAVCMSASRLVPF